MVNSASSSTANYLGVSLGGIADYGPNPVYLNVMKQADPWIPNGVATTNANADAKLNSDGYVTSMQGYSGTTYTAFTTTLFQNMWNAGPPPSSNFPPPGIVGHYPAGPYTFQFTGIGAITFGSDVSSIAFISGGTYSIAGKTFTSTQNVTYQVQLNLVSNGTNGLSFSLAGITSNTTYPRAMACVPSAYWSTAYENGGSEIFLPQYKAQLAPYSIARNMDWNRTNNLCPIMQLTAAPSATDTSATISNFAGTPINGAAYWPFPTGTWNVMWPDGTIRAINATYASATITFSATGVSMVGKGPNSNGIVFMVPLIQSYSSRPVYSNFTFLQFTGAPYEVTGQLCNELNMDMWCNAPVNAWTTTNTTSYFTSMANLLKSGTGSSLTTFTGLTSGTTVAGTSRRLVMQYGNEQWNLNGFAGPPNGYWAIIQGLVINPSSDGSEQSQALCEGQAIAGMYDAFSSVYGSAMSTSVSVVCGAQFAPGGYFYAKESVQQTVGSSTVAARIYASQGHGGFAIAPYFATGGQTTADMSVADQATLSNTADPLTAFFNLAYTNSYGGNTYSSVPTTGWLGSQIANAASYVTTFNNLGYSIPVCGYESGFSGSTVGTYTPGTGWNSSVYSCFLDLVLVATRDIRFRYIYHDPNSVLYSTYGVASAAGRKGFWIELGSSGVSYVNQFVDISAPTKYGFYGTLEGTTQAVSPVSSAPPRWQAAYHFGTGN